MIEEKSLQIPSGKRRVNYSAGTGRGRPRKRKQLSWGKKKKKDHKSEGGCLHSGF